MKQSLYLDEFFHLFCETLEETKAVSFHVNGFGQNPWPTDVGTDLCIFIEEVQSLLEWIRRSSEEVFNLDFYEQGIERNLQFSMIKDRLRIECSSSTKWRPNPSVEFIRLIDMKEMLRLFSLNFFDITNQIFISYDENSNFLKWKNKIINLLGQ
jgi:hypothetical protein